ncbi:SH3 domain-containing protein [Salipiger bermudensis]|uniref:SH3 domain-containing protein n=1 Tax=Salipiger bermudensis TaxID=344736 RepID=UPI001CD43AE9|nr:SH3 domain-containing protein [Salipiger bermudensis]MCA1287685.1 hypothetical protein [Salipiger bermudensis]
MTLFPIRAAMAALLLAVSMPQPAVAFEPGYAATLDDRHLDLRRAPGLDSRVIGRPGPGTMLRVRAVRGGWVQLVDLGGIYPSGWVEATTLAGLGWVDATRAAGTGEGMKLTRGTDAEGRPTGRRSFMNAPFGASQETRPSPVPSPTLPRPWPTVPGSGRQEPLSTDVARFDCRSDNGAGLGLAGCTLRLSVALEIPEAYAPFLTEEVALVCEASISYESLGAEDRRTIWQQDGMRLPVRDGTSGGDVMLRFDFSLEPDPVLSAEVESVDCQPRR